MSITLNDLRSDWLDAVWTSLVCAYERDHMDASHDLQHDIDEADNMGADAWLDTLYPARIQDCRATYGDESVDFLLDEAEFRARLYICARDNGLAAAMLMKLAHAGGAK